MQDAKPKSGRQPHSEIRIGRPFRSPRELKLLRALPNRGQFLSEKQLRDVGQAVSELCRHMRFPIHTFTAAMTIYMRTAIDLTRPHIFEDIVMPITASSCLFLACKVRNTMLGMHNLVEAVRDLWPAGNDEPHLPTANEIKSVLLYLESEICDSLVFDFRISSPHKAMIQICKEFMLPKNVGRVAWAIATDMYRTLCPLYQPDHVLAIAAITVSFKLKLCKRTKFDPNDLFFSDAGLDEVIKDLNGFYRQHYKSSNLAKEDVHVPEGAELDQLFRDLLSGTNLGSETAFLDHPPVTDFETKSQTLRFVPRLTRSLLSQENMLKPSIPIAQRANPTPADQSLQPDTERAATVGISGVSRPVKKEEGFKRSTDSLEPPTRAPSQHKKLKHADADSHHKYQSKSQDPISNSVRPESFATSDSKLVYRAPTTQRPNSNSRLELDARSSMRP